MKDIIHLDDLSGPRFELALDQLEVGLGFEFQDVWIHTEHGVLSCEAVNGTSLTEADAISLIEQAKAIFKRLQTSSARFKSFTERQTVKFCVIVDYGMGTAVIAELVENKLVWT
jgi:hypothetical protein